jgi:hypothetical protein
MERIAIAAAIDRLAAAAKIRRRLYRSFTNLDYGGAMTKKSADPSAGQEQAAGYMPRRTGRVPVDRAASLTPHDLYNVEVIVQNVSSAGFMAECAEPVRIGSYVMLEIPGIGPVEAQVRWQIGLKMGGMFLDPISLGRCEWTAEKAKAA